MTLKVENDLSTVAYGYNTEAAKWKRREEPSQKTDSPQFTFVSSASAQPVRGPYFHGLPHNCSSPV